MTPDVDISAVFDVEYMPLGAPGEGIAVRVPAIPGWRADVAAELDVASAVIWLLARRFGVERREIAVRVRRVDTFLRSELSAHV
ncbi:hypothetical protein [Nocardia sp. NPDC060249]|uniref:hypothetical protein n=1 Tax=Nocardia sp. NPDC060249 TaxID=3347082 RepID=UPI0036637893